MAPVAASSRAESFRCGWWRVPAAAMADEEEGAGDGMGEGMREGIREGEEVVVGGVDGVCRG